MPEAGNEAGRSYFVQKLGDPKKSEDREFHPDGNQIGNCRHDTAERNHLRFHLGLPLKHRHGGDPGYDQRDQGDDSHAVNDVRPGTQKIAEQCNNEDRDQIFEPAIDEENRAKRIKGWNKAVRYAFDWAKDEE